MQLPKKEIIIEYGDAGDLFFIILSGQVSVQKPVNKIFMLEPVPQLNLTGDLKKRVNNVNLPTSQGKINKRKCSILEKLSTCNCPYVDKHEPKCIYSHIDSQIEGKNKGS